MTAVLWLMVVLVSVADLAITVYGLQLGFVEVNPVAQLGLAVFGIWSLILLKGVALGIGAINGQMLDRHGYLVPATFLLVWGAAVVANLTILLSHGN